MNHWFALNCVLSVCVKGSRCSLLFTRWENFLSESFLRSPLDLQLPVINKLPSYCTMERAEKFCPTSSDCHSRPTFIFTASPCMSQPISVLEKHGGGGDLESRWSTGTVTWHSDYKRVFHVLLTIFTLHLRQRGELYYVYFYWNQFFPVYVTLF